MPAGCRLLVWALDLRKVFGERVYQRREQTMRPIIFVLTTAVFSLGQSAHVWSADAEAGRKIAEQHCSRCHVVGDFNPTGGISSTPSFQLLVKRRPDYRERFKTFYARRPHPAFLSIKGLGRLLDYLPPNAHPVEITMEDVKNVAAFAETLKPKKK